MELKIKRKTIKSLNLFNDVDAVTNRFAVRLTVNLVTMLLCESVTSEPIYQILRKKDLFLYDQRTRTNHACFFKFFVICI